MDYQDIKKYKGKFISLYTDYGRCFYGRPTKINKSQVFLTAEEFCGPAAC